MKCSTVCNCCARQSSPKLFDMQSQYHHQQPPPPPPAPAPAAPVSSVASSGAGSRTTTGGAGGAATTTTTSIAQQSPAVIAHLPPFCFECLDMAADFEDAPENEGGAGFVDSSEQDLANAASGAATRYYLTKCGRMLCEECCTKEGMVTSMYDKLYYILYSTSTSVDSSVQITGLTGFQCLPCNRSVRLHNRSTDPPNTFK